MVNLDMLRDIVRQVGDQLDCENLMPIETEERGKIIAGRDENKEWIRCSVPDDLWNNPTFLGIEQLIANYLNSEPSLAAA
ncbi:MAG: hypothetical protein WC536_01365 [Patescibacteria group bacterium]